MIEAKCHMNRWIETYGRERETYAKDRVGHMIKGWAICWRERCWGFYSIYLHSLYPWCDLSTNLILKT
jgi:hypothetical protein